MCSSREIIKNGDYKIELIEETYDKSRERWWVENTNCINKHVPGRTQVEWQIDNYEHRLEYNRQRYHDKKDSISKHKKGHYKNHKERIKQRSNELYHYQNSWGGDKRCNNNLLQIDVNLFN